MTKARRMLCLPILYFLIAYLFIFLLKSPEQASSACLNSISLCLFNVIPALFPFLVLNEVMFSSGLSTFIGKRIGAVLCKPLGITPNGAASFVCGCLFGFPLGTKSVCLALERGLISKEEAEKLVCFCSNTGPAFVIGFVGGILQNKRAALCIYLCQVLSAVIIGLFLRKKSVPTYDQIETRVYFGIGNIPKAITSSVFPMMNICAFVCFFSCVSASVENLLFHFNLNEYTEILFTGVLELTNGIGMLSGFAVDNITIWLCSFFIGWSGLSVIMQSLSIMGEHGIRKRKFALCKLVQGILCANLSVLFCNLLNLY